MTPLPPGRDRRQLLLDVGATWNGIDYVEVAADQIHLYVHFLNSVAVSGTLVGTSPVTITGGEVITTVTVGPIDPTAAFTTDSAGRPVLALSVDAPGDFSTYQLALDSTVLDPYFAAVPFSFKANCPSDLDCATVVPACAAADGETVVVDYLAKDFGSFTRAVSELSAQRYPAWVERSEADLGVMVMEAMSAIADELSYYQDRVAGEARLDTASQRLSVVRHARLVDYEPAPTTAATTLVQLDVNVQSTAITTPLHCRAVGADSITVDFEVGNGLADPSTGREQAIDFPVDARWNRFTAGAPAGTYNLPPYWWDDTTVCLPAGSVELYLVGHGHDLQPGQLLLLDTAGASSADPPVREVVTISSQSASVPAEMLDPVLNVELTKVTLAAPTAHPHDLSVTEVAGNLVPVVQGLRTTDWFFIPGPPPSAPPSPLPPGLSPSPALVRTGRGSTPENPLPDYRFCLSATPVAWIARTGSGAAADTEMPAWPEVVLTEESAGPGGEPWSFARWLLDAGAGDRSFTLTPERYSPVLTSSGTTWFDYDGDDATTIRFGDGVFGATPVPDALFRALYRVGGGTVGNVPAGTIVSIAPGQVQGGLVISCTNPFPATGGSDAETNAQVAVRAPAKFSVEPLRVVQPRDYVAAVESLPFVQQAGTSFRWTGSWMSVFTAADPVGAEQPTMAELGTVTDLLNRRRLAGYDSFVVPPRYVSLDLVVVVCADPTFFASGVEAAVLARLRPGATPGGRTGFFDHANWEFGQPLESAALFAAIQGCPGVAGVFSAQYRRRGVELVLTDLPGTLTFAADQILRIDDDPSRPEAGSITVSVEGGK